MFQTSRGGTADSVNLFKFLKVGVGANDDGVEPNLVLETVDIVCGVGVNVLKRLCELIIQAIDNGNNGSLDENSLAILWDTILFTIILVGNVLLYNIARVGLQDCQKQVDVLFSAARDEERTNERTNEQDEYVKNHTYDPSAPPQFVTKNDMKVTYFFQRGMFM